MSRVANRLDKKSLGDKEANWIYQIILGLVGTYASAQTLSTEYLNTLVGSAAATILLGASALCFIHAFLVASELDGTERSSTASDTREKVTVRRVPEADDR